MNIESLFNKYSGKEKQDKDAKMLSKRLLYRDVKDNNIYLFVLALTGMIGGLLLYFTSNLTVFYGICLVLYYVALLFLYSYRPRTCGRCNNKMIRFENGDNILYCCDTCETKFKLIVTKSSE